MERAHTDQSILELPLSNIRIDYINVPPTLSPTFYSSCDHFYCIHICLYIQAGGSEGILTFME